jgi:sulfate/thiosulfate transport system ATP-binding protein
MGIQVENITKKFGTFKVLDRISFEVPDGSLTALLGPSGGGKSTLLRIVAGLEQADEGSVYLDGKRIDAEDARTRGIGFVFQHYALFRHMTVRENVEYGLRVRGMSKDKRRERSQELLSLIGLDGLADRYPGQLSGGQRQRVALARALAPAPRVLLLDEPFAAVDAKVRSELQHWIRKLHDEIHVTSLFVTHDQEEAFSIADLVVFINDGKVEQVGSAQDVIDQPKSEFVARFIGEVNVIDAEVNEEQHAVRGLLSVAAPDFKPGSKVRLVIRSHEIAVWGNPDGIGRIERITRFGDRTKIHLSVEGVGKILVSLPEDIVLHKSLSVGQRADLKIPRPRIYGMS